MSWAKPVFPHSKISPNKNTLVFTTRKIRLITFVLQSPSLNKRIYDLSSSHKHEARIHGSKYPLINRFQEYLGEFVYGGIDGSVTTFAVVAGAAGAQGSFNLS